MKTLVGNQKCFVFILVSFLILLFGTLETSYGAKNVGEPRTVRLFYFLPNDRPYRQEVVDAMKTGILEVQSFFAEQMAAHGHGNKTFNIETDAQGDPIVHRIDADYGDSQYVNRGYTEGEIARAFDTSKIITVIVMDISSYPIKGQGTGNKSNGWLIMWEDWDWFTAAHELGHAFGLQHDFRDNAYILSYGRPNRSSAQLSACAAEYLAVHPYFNPDIPIEEGQPPTIELISSTEYPSGSESMPIRLRVRDDDGLHQVILFVLPKNPFLGGTPEVKACHGLVGETDTVVEFNFDGRLPSDNVGTAPSAHTTLSNTARHPIYVVAVDTDGNRTTSPKSFTLEEGHSPQHIANIDRQGGGYFHSAAFSPDGTTLATGTGGGVRLYNASTMEYIIFLRHTEGNIYGNDSVVFSPDGTLLASGSADSTIKLWNVATKENIATFEGHTDRIFSVDFSPDGTLLASGSWDSTIKLWNVATKENIATLEGHTDRIFSVDFSPDGTLASSSTDGTVKLWDVTTKAQIATIETGHTWSTGIAFSPDGTTLATSSRYTSKLWNVATRTQIATLNYTSGNYTFLSLVFSPDGTILASSTGAGVHIWDVLTRENIGTFSGGPGGVGRLIFSPDGTELISVSGGAVKFWDVSEWSGSPMETSPLTPVSERTRQVRDAIVAAVPGVNSANDVTAAHLAAITSLSIRGSDITALRSGDFDGLTALTTLRVAGTKLSSLPSGIFDNLTTLTELYLGGNNDLNTLPSGIFDNLSALKKLYLNENGMPSLRSGVFDNLTVLEELGLGGNDLRSLPSGLFDNLTALKTLNMSYNELVSLRSGVFDNNTALTELHLYYNDLRSLPSGIFDNLTALKTLTIWKNDLSSLSAGIFDNNTALTNLSIGFNKFSSLPSGIFNKLTNLIGLSFLGNQLSSLPNGIFDGLSALTSLNVSQNPVDPLLLTVSLEKVGTDQFKAVAPTGAPFEMVLPISVTNGSINGGATTITIPAGSVESETLTVTRTPGTTSAVSVDIETLPALPQNHTGYTLVKSADLPLKVTEGDIADESVLTLTVGAGPGAALRGYNQHSIPEWDFGSFSPQSFELNDVSYTMYKLTYSVAGKRLQLQTIPHLPGGFALHLDAQQFTSVTALDYNQYTWNNVELDWSDGKTVQIGFITTPPMPPGPPTNLQATPGYEKVTLSWIPPANADPIALPITEYEYRISVDGGNTWDPDWETIGLGRTGHNTLTSCTFGDRNNNRNVDNLIGINLTNGTSYTFEIRARGGDGYSEAARITVVPDGSTPISERTPQVRDAIVAAVPGVNSAADVTEAHLAAITILNLRGKGITNLKTGDFSGLTSLTNLNLRHNNITSLPSGIFYNLISLTELNLDGNNLTNLPSGVFDYNTALSELYLYSNEFTSFPQGIFDRLTALTTLDCSFNDLANLRSGVFDRLTALTTLELDANALTSLPSGIFDNLTSLTNLELSDNTLTTLPSGIFDNLTSLTNLYLSDTSISNISELDGLTSLTFLTLYNNSISDISALEDLTSLTFLRLDNNSISDISALEDLTALTRLFLSGNSISDYAPLRRLIAAIEAAGRSLTLDITIPASFLLGNRTQQVRDAIVAAVPGVNSASDVTEAHLAAITSLWLSDEDIETLKADDFNGLTALTVLDLSDNQLSKLPEGIFDELINLEWLYLDNNNLTTLPTDQFSNLTKLTALRLSNNALTNLPENIFNGLTALEQLWLSSNSLTDLPENIFSGLTALTELALSNNAFTTLPEGVFDGLTALGYLSLSNTKLTSLPDGIFEQLTLTDIILSDNAFTTLPEGIFDGLTGIRILYLDGNSVDPLPLTVSLEKVGTDQFKAVAPTGATFDFVLPISVSNGKITGGATSVTIPKGSVESEVLTVTRTPGTTAAVTVDIGTLPSLPIFHNGYTLVKSDDLPLTFTAPSETTLMAIKGTITEDGTPAEAGLAVTVTIGSDTKTATSEAGGVYSVIFLNTQGVVATSGDTVTVQVLNPNTGEDTERTISLSSEQITAKKATIDLQFSPLGREYLLSVPTGISLIHVPLEVTAVDSVAQTIESIADLYDALGGASSVSLLITLDPQAQQWRGYFGSGDRGSSADKVLTDDLGIIAVMTAPASVQLSGDGLGINGSSSITLHPGMNLVGVPLKDSRITRVTDLFALEGIKDNVSLTLVSDNGEIKLVEQPGDSGDIPVTGGQSFILVAKSAATVEISGAGWSNVPDPAVAPSTALTGIEVRDTTPVLAMSGSILPPVGGASLPRPVGGASLPRLGVTDFSVTIKNLSTGKVDTSVTDNDGVTYQFTFVDIERGRAAQVGDILEITAHSPDPFVGVQPLRYVVTVEDVKRSHIPLAELVAYEIPAQTELLLNYPNPFNPETWIPYRLAKDAFVTVTIYDQRGRVVRDIAVGHRIAAVYESRSEAIYWDGRTEFGERVASGIYFYTLTAGDYSATRKMVILK